MRLKAKKSWLAFLPLIEAAVGISTYDYFALQNLKTNLIILASVIVGGLLAHLEQSNFALNARCSKDEAAITRLRNEIALSETSGAKDRYRMIHGSGDSPWVFLYDGERGRVWRYYRNMTEDGKSLQREGMAFLLDASESDPNVRKTIPLNVPVDAHVDLKSLIESYPKETQPAPSARLPDTTSSGK